MHLLLLCPALLLALARVAKCGGCQIPKILHGSLKDKVLGRQLFNISTFRYERKVEYNTISEGNTVPSAKVLYLFCEDRHTFQGTAHQMVEVRCLRGSWNKDPVCLREGDIYVPNTTDKHRLSSSTTFSLYSVTSSRGRYGPSETASTKEFTLSTIPSRVSTSLATEEVATSPVTVPETEHLQDQCSCNYPSYNRNIVAHSNGKRLSLDDKVQNGAKIIFRCLHVGYHYLIGPTEITCTDCQLLHSSDFPTCTEPQKGNVVITFDENVTVLEDGTLEISKGQNVNFSCIAVETPEYPKWNVPEAERISFKSESKERKNYKDIIFQTHFYIQDADYSHAGTYYCSLKNHRKTTFNVTVIDPDIHCPVFPKSNDLIITYEKDRRENSKAYFSCTNKSLELVGESVLTCLGTKEWSAPLPFCSGHCRIPRILHGSLKDKVLGRRFFNIHTFRYERRVTYNTVSVGSTVPHIKVLHLFCEDGRTYQGTNHEIVAAQCIRGSWKTDLLCLRRGEIYRPTTTVKPQLLSPATISLQSVTTSRGRYRPSESATTNEFPLPTTPSRVSTSLETEEVTTTAVVTDPKIENLGDQCSCKYPLNDKMVVAHANGKRLSFDDKVQNGATVIFRCLYVGYHHLIGRTEITCADCQPWHSSDFPFCTEPRKGNVVVAFDETDDVTVSEDGTIEINKGQNATFSCIAVETAEYPKWNVPEAERISFKSEFREREKYGDVLFQTHFYIQDADYSHTGTYYCFLTNQRNTTFNVTVIDPDIHCPVFPSDKDLIITYEKERRENSKAFFSCTNKNLELVGEPASTCLRTKEWSAPLPFCAARCKKLKDSDHLTVHYTNNRKAGSLALFHCFAPGVRIGASSAECLKNGSWSQPTPSCKVSYSCTAENLLSLLPLNAQPAIEIGKDDSFPVNSKVELTCKNDMVVIGNPLATCGNGSKWSYDKVECDSACQPPARRFDSKLKLSPEKNVYKFGEQVTFSCPPGMKLDSESQLIMCLVHGWSEKIVPDCVQDDKSEDY